MQMLEGYTYKKICYLAILLVSLPRIAEECLPRVGGVPVSELKTESNAKHSYTVATW